MMVDISDNPHHLSYIPMDRIASVWSAVRRFILPAATLGGEMTEEMVIAAFGACKLHLFVVYDKGRLVGAATGSIDEYPNHKVANMDHLGGDWAVMAQHLSEFETWASALGASVLRIRGRRGWRRRLEPLGFKEKFVTLEKEIGRIIVTE
jgi:hypothetical protein